MYWMTSVMLRCWKVLRNSGSFEESEVVLCEHSLGHLLEPEHKMISPPTES